MIQHENNTADTATEHVSKRAAQESRMADAIELAQILYELYKEQQSNAKVDNGQNHAKYPYHT